MDFSTALLIGKRQTGRTTYIVQSALEKIFKGAGIALFDPYGTATDLLLPRIPPDLWDQVVLLEYDPEHPFSYNPLYNSQNHSRTTDTQKHTLKSAWDYLDFPTPQMDVILSNAIFAGLESESPTLVQLESIITSDEYRKRILKSADNFVVKRFWEKFFGPLQLRQQLDETRSTLSKIRAITTDPVTRNILGQTVSRIHLPDIMKGKILVVNLAVSKFGIEASRLLGSLLLADLHQAALSHEGDFYCYIDGADRFAESIQVEMAEMTSGASYLFSISHLEQVGKRFRSALLASDVLTSFRLSIFDAKLLQPLFLPGDSENDNINDKLHSLKFGQMAVSDAWGNRCFERLDPLNFVVYDDALKEIRHRSRNKHTRQRREVEEDLKRFIRNS